MIGTSVRINSKCSSNGRTGIVTETPTFWAAMGWHRVALDAPTRAGIYPASELVVITAGERPTTREQLGLFGGAA